MCDRCLPQIQIATTLTTLCNTVATWLLPKLERKHENVFETSNSNPTAKQSIGKWERETEKLNGNCSLHQLWADAGVG